MRGTILSFCFALALSVQASGDVLTVDPAGGSDFTDILSAVAQASDGDVVLLRNGTYWTYVTIDGKGLTLAMESAMPVLIGKVVVRNLPAGSSVYLLNLETTRMVIEDCAGTVRVADCLMHEEASAINSSNVVFTRCESRGQSATFTSTYSRPGLWSYQSRVALFDCSLFGGAGYDGTGGPFGSYDCPVAGSPGLTVNASEAYAMNCTFLGGAGNGGGAGPGVAVSSDAQAYMTGIPSITAGDTFAPDISGTVQFLGQSRREIELPNIVREGEVQVWTITGRPGDRVYLVDSTLGDWRYLPSVRGTLALKFTGPPVPAFQGVIDASSVMTIPVVAPTLPLGVEATVTQHQVFVITADDERVLGQVAPQVVLQAGL
jgi:hypothetical protein